MDAGLAVHLNVTLSWELSAQEVLLSLWREHNGLLALSPTRKGMDDPVKGALVRAVFSSWSMLLGPMWLILSTASLTSQNLVKFQDILWNLKRA